MGSPKPCVIGVDPGTLKIGVGVVSIEPEPQILYCKTVVLKGETLEKRLGYQFDVLKYLITQYQPKALTCEEAFYHKNPRSALLLGHSRGVILLASQITAGVRFVEFAPTEIKKKIVGTGHASKQQMQEMIVRHFKLLRAPTEDAADALALCLCYIRDQERNLRYRGATL